MSDESDEEFTLDEDEPIVSARNPELARRMENMRQEMMDIQQRAQQADSLAKRALQLVNEKDQRIDELETEVRQLRDDVEDVRENQSILTHVASVGDLSVDERAMALLQTLFYDARESDSNTSYMTVREAWTELRREIPRSRVYDAVERAETLVDNEDLCRYKKEKRGHQPPSRLILDLSEDNMPEEINGHPIKRGGWR